MTLKVSSIDTANLNSYHRQSYPNEQTNQIVNSIDAYLQSGELFSKDADSQQTEGILLQQYLSKFPDGTRILQVGPPLIIDIPDSYIEAVRNSQLGTDRQPFYEQISEDLAIYRKKQSDFLIGKLKPDHT